MSASYGCKERRSRMDAVSMPSCAATVGCEGCAVRGLVVARLAARIDWARLGLEFRVAEVLSQHGKRGCGIVTKR